MQGANRPSLLGPSDCRAAGPQCAAVLGRPLSTSPSSSNTAPADNVPGQTSGPPEGRFDIGWLLPLLLPLHSNACRFQNTLASSHLDRGNSRPAGQRQPSQAIRELATGVFSCGYFSPRMPVERLPKLLLSSSHASGSLPVRLC